MAANTKLCFQCGNYPEINLRTSADNTVSWDCGQSSRSSVQLAYNGQSEMMLKERVQFTGIARQWPHITAIDDQFRSFWSPHGGEHYVEAAIYVKTAQQALEFYNVLQNDSTGIRKLFLQKVFGYSSTQLDEFAMQISNQNKGVFYTIEGMPIDLSLWGAVQPDTAASAAPQRVVPVEQDRHAVSMALAEQQANQRVGSQRRRGVGGQVQPRHDPDNHLPIENDPNERFQEAVVKMRDGKGHPIEKKILAQVTGAMRHLQHLRTWIDVFQQNFLECMYMHLFLVNAVPMRGKQQAVHKRLGHVQNEDNAMLDGVSYTQHMCNLLAYQGGLTPKETQKDSSHQIVDDWLCANAQEYGFLKLTDKSKAMFTESDGTVLQANQDRREQWLTSLWDSYANAREGCRASVTAQTFLDAQTENWGKKKTTKKAPKRKASSPKPSWAIVQEKIFKDAQCHTFAQWVLTSDEALSQIFDEGHNHNFMQTMAAAPPPPIWAQQTPAITAKAGVFNTGEAEQMQASIGMTIQNTANHDSVYVLGWVEGNRGGAGVMFPRDVLPSLLGGQPFRPKPCHLILCVDHSVAWQEMNRNVKVKYTHTTLEQYINANTNTGVVWDHRQTSADHSRNGPALGHRAFHSMGEDFVDDLDRALRRVGNRTTADSLVKQINDAFQGFPKLYLPISEDGNPKVVHHITAEITLVGLLVAASKPNRRELYGWCMSEDSSIIMDGESIANGCISSKRDGWTLPKTARHFPQALLRLSDPEDMATVEDWAIIRNHGGLLNEKIGVVNRKSGVQYISNVYIDALNGVIGGWQTLTLADIGTFKPAGWLCNHKINVGLKAEGGTADYVLPYGSVLGMSDSNEMDKLPLDVLNVDHLFTAAAHGSNPLSGSSDRAQRIWNALNKLRLSADTHTGELNAQTFDILQTTLNTAANGAPPMAQNAALFRGFGQG